MQAQHGLPCLFAGSCLSCPVQGRADMGCCAPAVQPTPAACSAPPSSQVFGPKLQLPAPCLAAFAAELLQPATAEVQGRLLCPEGEESLVGAVHCRLLELVGRASSPSAPPGTLAAPGMGAGAVHSATGLFSSVPIPGLSCFLALRHGIWGPAWAPAHCIPCHAPPHPTPSHSPFQVRTYWNVRGGVGPSAWQGIMKAYYAAALLTPRQALELRWQHGPPAVAGEIFSRPAGGSQASRRPSCCCSARPWQGGRSISCGAWEPWRLHRWLQGYARVFSPAIPVTHPLFCQAESEEDVAAAAAAGDESGEAMEVDGGAVGAALGVGSATAVDFPGGSYWALPAAARIAMLHALVNDALECGELR